MNLRISLAAAAVAAMGMSTNVMAVPVAGQIVPIAVYQSINGAFGLAYDSANDLMWASLGDSGDNNVHAFKPFKNYTAGEKALMPLGLGGVLRIDNAVGQLNVGGNFNPGGVGGSGSGAHFSALAFNAATGQLAQTSSGAIRTYDPITGANQGTLPAGLGTGFSDGLDIAGANVWFDGTPDVGDIDRTGVLFASTSNPAQTFLPGWAGLGDATGDGWSGFTQVGGSLFAVAVHNNSDTGRSRTIVRFNAGTGELLGFDPDGDPVAARFEDLAFDGEFLYAADLRGNEDGTGPNGDVYVFGVTGGLVDADAIVPEPDILSLLSIGLFGGWLAHRRSKLRIHKIIK